MTTLPWSTIVMAYACPTIGAMLSNIMFSAPVLDLRKALVKGSLGPLSPLPWAIMTGNCVGWCAYAYYTRDAFVLAANLPGLLVSFWLNFGAIKIQYLETVDVQKRDESTGEGEREKLTMVPQETTLLRVLVVWSFVLLWVGWLHPAGNAAHFVGLVVNVNLVFFYGAPLNTIRQVLSEKNSNSIHCPTMVLNWVNTSFWLVYGFARRDLIIMIPNGLGLLLGLSQGVLSLLYPRTGRNHEDELDDEEASRNSLIV